MNDAAIVLLLFVAAGLLIVLGTGLGRERGRQPSERDTAVMAAMTGITVGFLTVFLLASPLAVGPIAIGLVLVGAWWRRVQVVLIGAFLGGAGGTIATMSGMWLLNDLGDPAISHPGWTTLPLALGVALSILGATLVIAGRHEKH